MDLQIHRLKVTVGQVDVQTGVCGGRVLLHLENVVDAAVLQEDGGGVLRGEGVVSLCDHSAGERI